MNSHLISDNFLKKKETHLVYGVHFKLFSRERLNADKVLREEQDQAYYASLKADQEKVSYKCIYSSF